MTTPKRRQVAALIATTALTGGLLGATGAGTASAAERVSASAAATVAPNTMNPVNPDTVLPSTQFTVTGKLSDKTVRKVVLEARSGKSKRTIKTVKSKKNGTYSFSKVKLSSTADLVAVAPKQTIKGDTSKAAKKKLAKAKAKQKVAAKKVTTTKKAYKKKKSAKNKKAYNKAVKALAKAKKATKKAKDRIKKVVGRSESKPFRVTVVKAQSATAVALPPVAQAGSSPASPRTDAVVSFKFVPARAGRKVELQQNKGGVWSTVQSQSQDRSGHAVFNVAANGTFRARTVKTTELAQVVSPQVTSKAFKLDFSDTFDGSQLDAKKWKAQERPLGTGLRSCARTDGSSYSVAGGTLRLGVSKDPTRKDTCSYKDDQGKTHQLPYMRNTQIATEKNYTYQYGTLAARVKVQSAVGMHTAVWSQPIEEAVANQPAKGIEADVMEYFGDSQGADTGIASFQHVLRSNDKLDKIGGTFPETAKMKGNVPFSANYHVFSLEWTPTAYIFRVDGREYHRSTRDISHTPQYVLLSNLTSSYELVNLKKFGDVASVDWVQVWK